MSEDKLTVRRHPEDRVIGQKVLLLMPMDLVKYWLYRHFIFLSNFYI